MSVEFFLRLVGMVVFGILGWQLGVVLGGSNPTSLPYIVVLSLAGSALGLLVTPYFTVKPFQAVRETIRRLPAHQLMAAIAGLVVGLIVAALLALPLSMLPSPLGQVLPFVGAVIFAYLGMAVMIMRQRDMFSLVESRLGSRDGQWKPREHGGMVLLDTSVIIDGRIADISHTGFVTGVITVPRFVLAELQHIADSPDALRRNRGRRGLEMLNKLQKDSTVPIRISDMDVDGVREVDDKLVVLAKQLRCPIITNDYNLNRVAELQGVTVLNINELANAVKSVTLPGEKLQVLVIQEGKDLGQGVGYLDDGTMVVVENGRQHINGTIDVIVTKVLQTAAGRMLFASPLVERE
jgi:uncharacterized protein YacL